MVQVVAKRAPKARATLSSIDRAKLRLETMCSNETISRWARGETDLRAATVHRIEKACECLGIEVSREVM